MRTITNEYLDLIAECQVFLFQEYSRQSWLEVSRESYLNYRQYAISKQEPEKRRQEPVARRQEIIARSQEPVVRRQEPEAKIQEPEKRSPELEVRSKEQPPSVEKQDFSDIRKSLAERFPEQIILPQPPDDAIAKNIKNGWKNSPQHPQIFLVVSKPQPRHSSFLTNICNALKIVHGLGAFVVEKSLLGDVKELIIELEDLDIYLREPKRKAHLWHAISQKCKEQEKG